jgi:hypothetical protein
MNRGKRHIRNTLLALLATAVWFPVASRLQASVVKPDTSPWVRSLVSLGQTVVTRGDTAAQVQAVRMEDAGQLRFSQIGVEGDFAVEVVGAPLHKVSLGGGHAGNVTVAGQADGLLLLKGTAGHDAVLRIEAPALTSINARNLPKLTIRGMQAPRLSIATAGVTRVHLQDASIGLWIVRAETPVVLEADAATMAAGVNVQGYGAISVSGPDGQKVRFRGSGQLSVGGPGETGVRAGK